MLYDRAVRFAGLAAEAAQGVSGLSERYALAVLSGFLGVQRDTLKFCSSERSQVDAAHTGCPE